MEDLGALVQELAARVEALETENAALRRRRPHGERQEGGPVSRRNLLRLSGAAAGVAAGAVLLRPQGAGATTAVMQFGTTNDAGTTLTELTSSAVEQTLLLTNSNAVSGGGLRVANTNANNNGPLVAVAHGGLGDAIDVLVSNTASSAAGINLQYAGTSHALDVNTTNVTNADAAVHGTHHGTGSGVLGEITSPDGGPGVAGFGINGGGVVGVTTGGAPGVGGITTAGATGAGVNAWGIDATSSAVALEAQHSGLGHAVYAHIDNPQNTHRAVYARTVGTGIAILAGIANANSAAAALQSSTTGTGAGVDAASSRGVGGRFTGKTAQARLVPSTAATHPASGTAGDLFVDSAKRLWFCKGGATWHQIA